MKKIDVEKLFRANQHRFTEKPSKETWNRLESRLDDHFGRSRNRRLNRQRPIAMAAALLILIVMVGVISMLTDNQRSVSGTSPQASIQFEEIHSDSDEQVVQVIEFTRKHHDRLAKPISEGDETKKLHIAQ